MYSETGHAKNVANFQDLIEFATGYGMLYNPFKTKLHLSELIILKTTAEVSLGEVIAKNTEFNRRINERIIKFSVLKSLATRLINALQVTDANAKTLEDARAFVRKIHGKRASLVKLPLDPNSPAPKSISANQQSFDQLTQHFSGLIAILSTEPSYNPNEIELQVESLLALLQEMIAMNTAVAVAYTAVSNARIARDTALYGKENGLVTIAMDVKAYIKSVFGASSPQYRQVQSIEIRRIR